MRVALIHDWLLNLGGAERTLIALHRIFPDAPIFTIFYKPIFIERYLPDAQIIPSKLQKIPLVAKIYPWLFFLMPSAVESFDFSDYDLVISSSVIFSKGLVLKPKTKHICYCYSPTRFLWDRNTEYESGGFAGRLARHYLRVWDRLASERPDKFVAISQTVKNRIRKYYGRDSEVIYPPLTMADIKSDFVPTEKDYYLIVSRLFDFKKISVAIDVFNKLGLPLIIIGEGPAGKKLRRLASKNIIFKGFLADEFLAGYYKNCRALIMPQEEDFGLTPLEAMSFGRPVLALKRGGATETVTEGISGEFFDDSIPEALADGIRRLGDNYSKYQPEKIKKTTEQFSPRDFRNAILKLAKE